MFDADVSNQKYVIVNIINCSTFLLSIYHIHISVFDVWFFIFKFNT